MSAFNINHGSFNEASFLKLGKGNDAKAAQFSKRCHEELFSILPGSKRRKIPQHSATGI